MTTWELTSGLTLVDVLRQHAVREPDRKFCKFDDGDWLTYSNLWLGSARFASALGSLGVEPGERVVVFMSKRFEYVVAMFGTMISGAVYVPANSEYTPDQLRVLLEDCSPKVILTDDHFEEVASSAANGLGIKVVSADEPNLSGATAHLADHLDSSVTDLETRAETEAAALIMYTSGTTGKPKGVTFSHGNVMYEAMLKGLSRSSEDRGLDFFPLHHFNGGFGQIVPVINNAGSVVFQSDFDPVDFGSQLNKHGITHAAVNSNHVYALLEQPPNSKDQDHECRFMTLGLKLDANTHRAFEARYRTRLLGVYGLTEAVGPFIRESHEYVTSPHSSGRPLPGYEVAVLDEQGERLPPGSQGEVVVRSQSRHGFFLGYWNDPERTKQTLSDEWMRTGDMGYVEPDGRFVYLQRIADMARRGGHRVAPFQTEEVMFEHPAVQEVAVIGLADDPDHETLVSILILHDSDGNREETLAEIKSMCAERVQPSLVPDHILTSQRFPKDILGKLDRKRLRQEIKDRLTAQK